MAAAMNPTQFIVASLGGLAGASSHMQAGTVLVLARLLYEYKASLNQQTVSGILTAVLPMFSKTEKEVLKATVSFCKVASLALEADNLTPHLPSMVQGLSGASEEKSLRMKVRSALALLLKKVGFEALRPLVPHSHVKQLEHLRKSHARNERQKEKKAQEWKTAHSAAAIRKDARAEALGQNEKKTNTSTKELSYEDIVFGSDEENEDEDDVVMDSQSTTNSYIRDDDVDFLDPSAVRAITASKPTTQKPKTARRARGDGFEIDPDGRLVVPEDDDEDGQDSKMQQMQDSDDDDDDEDAWAGPGQWKKKGTGVAKRKRGDADQPVEDARSGAGSWNDRKFVKAGRKKKGGDITGGAYRAKKAGGDMKKGNLDPFAWVALDPRDMNRRNAAKGQRRFESVVRAARQGAMIGSKIGKKGKKAHNKRVKRMKMD
jgi:ribosomal RNA-processing protein 12